MNMPWVDTFLSKKIWISVFLLFFLISMVLAPLAAGAEDLEDELVLPASFDEALESPAALLMDVRSGDVLFAKNENKPLEPASLTKIMTAYLAFQEVKSGTISMEDRVLISEKAWRTGGSKMFVLVGDNVLFEDLIKGMTVASGNDACVAIAERLGGSEEGFVQMMNQTAAQMGLTNTLFQNPHGLPAEEHFASAMDVAVLSRRHILDNPEALKYHSQREFTYAIETPQYNRNSLLWEYDGADGLKTGSTTAAGFCLVATAQRDGDRFLAVVMGAPNSGVRTQEITKMLDYAFANYTTAPIADKEESLGELRIWKGDKNVVQVGPKDVLALTVPAGYEEKVDFELVLDGAIEAPLAEGEVVGEVVLTVYDTEMRRDPVVALESVEQGGGFKRFFDGVRFFFARLFRRV